MVYVATYFEVQPRSAEPAATLVTKYVEDARRESGNLRADPFREIGRSNRFVVIEHWAGEASFAAHEEAASTRAFREELGRIEHSPFDQRVNTAFEVDSRPIDLARDAVLVVTHVDVPGNRREDTEQLLRSLAVASRAGAGNVRYDVYQQLAPRTNHFTVFAAWSDASALETDGLSQHWLQFRKALAPMLGAPYDERLYQRLMR